MLPLTALEAHQALFAALQVVGGALERLEPLEDARAFFEQRQALGGRHQAAADAVEQRVAQLELGVRDRAADC